ncbi:TetR/AcrR family transcriptional regulator [Gorillibacterium sp. sgz5001074]|uniref:TetR/AcrR family transcriptional regulator n=1 Tax=Gorillibacterium sp. sgz5001074 TaxID=3446695 RepID=UPI003F662A4E
MAGGSKAKVVLAAMELFHRKGFQSTGLEEILSASGVCKSNFYYHFKSKDELGLSVLEEKMREMQRDYIEPALGDYSVPPRERLIRFFEGMIRFCDENGCSRGCIFGNMTLELADHHEGIRSRLVVFFRELETRVRDTLQEGARTGGIALQGMPADELATAVVSLLQGGILLTRGYKDTSPLASGLHLLIRFIGGVTHNEHTGSNPGTQEDVLHG